MNRRDASGWAAFRLPSVRHWRPPGTKPGQSVQDSPLRCGPMSHPNPASGRGRDAEGLMEFRHLSSRQRAAVVIALDDVATAELEVDDLLAGLDPLGDHLQRQ